MALSPENADILDENWANGVEIETQNEDRRLQTE
jgi:hypothetical protein